MEAIAKEASRQERLTICRACPSVKFTWGVGMTCGDFLRPTENPKTCGCKMSLKTKLANAECPQGKWLKISKDV